MMVPLTVGAMMGLAVSVAGSGLGRGIADVDEGIVSEDVEGPTGIAIVTGAKGCAAKAELLVPPILLLAEARPNWLGE